MVAKVTYQNLFRLFPRLSGMTGKHSQTKEYRRKGRGEDTAKRRKGQAQMGRVYDTEIEEEGKIERYKEREKIRK